MPPCKPRWLAISWGVAVLTLVVGSLLQRFTPASHSVHNIYQSGWFLAIWGLFIALALWQSIRWSKEKKDFYPLAFMVGVLFLLVGAICTTFQEKEATFTLATRGQQTLFTTRQDSLNVILTSCHTSDYEVVVEIFKEGKITQKILSPNHIAKSGGWRIFLLAVGKDGATATLKAVYNPLGTIFTYVGFAVALLAFALFLLKKSLLLPRIRTFFRKRESGTRGGFPSAGVLPFVIAILLLFSNIDAVMAQRTLTKSCADELGKIAVYYNGRVAPLETLCNDCARELCGSTHYANFSSVQLTIGWLLFPEDWFYEPVLKIRGSEVRRAWQLPKRAAPADFFLPNGQFRQPNCAASREWERVNQQLGRLQQIRSGELFKIYFVENQWFVQADTLHRELSDFFPLLQRAISQSDETACLDLIKQLSEAQAKTMPAGGKLRLERAYNRCLVANRWVAVCIVLLAFLLAVFKDKVFSIKWLKIAIALVFSYFLLQFFVRWYLCGHIPIASGYETLLLLCLLFQFIALIGQKRHATLVIFCLLFSGFALLVSSLPFNNPSVSVIPPLLDSPLLCLHVLVIMVAYAGFALAFGLSAAAAILPFFCKKRQNFNHWTQLSRRWLCPAVWLLAAGIVLGSVWANVSWGSYWSWDPKEVWALITFMVYLPALLDSYFQKFANLRFYNFYVVIAFVCVLITYFGVNVVFGGVHQY